MRDFIRMGWDFIGVDFWGCFFGVILTDFRKMFISSILAATLPFDVISDPEPRYYSFTDFLRDAADRPPVLVNIRG